MDGDRAVSGVAIKFRLRRHSKYRPAPNKWAMLKQSTISMFSRQIRFMFANYIADQSSMYSALGSESRSAVCSALSDQHSAFKVFQRSFLKVVVVLKIVHFYFGSYLGQRHPWNPANFVSSFHSWLAAPGSCILAPWEEWQNGIQSLTNKVWYFYYWNTNSKVSLLLSVNLKNLIQKVYSIFILVRFAWGIGVYAGAGALWDDSGST